MPQSQKANISVTGRFIDKKRKDPDNIQEVTVVYFAGNKEYAEKLVHVEGTWYVDDVVVGRLEHVTDLNNAKLNKNRQLE